jgi:hypothetical protein
MPYPETNASFQALKLLGEFFGKDANVLRELWEALKGILRESNNTLRFRDDGWEQDWLLAKYGAEAPGVGTRGWYEPPVDFHAFPTFDVDVQLNHLEQAGITIRRTKNNVNPSELFARTATAFSGPMALDDFYALEGQIRSHGDAAMAQLNQALAWLHLGLGRLFDGAVLTPDLDLQAAVAMLAQRWSMVWAEKDAFEDTMDEPELLQWKLDVLYGAEIEPNRLVFQPARQGQPRRWQQNWQWLSCEIEPQRALEATRLAARLMICPPVLVFLKAQLHVAVEGAGPADQLLALIILRRLTLQLQAMSWLENALQHPFEHVRTLDLTSFAFSALRPHWPRRLFALSHRSVDIKAALMGLKAWGNFRYSIDAQFAPHWETNVATVWGLFSAVPGLIRIRSANYDTSVWCAREREIFDYLCEEDDFLHGRHVIELDEAHLPLIDAAIPPPDSATFSLAAAGQFPPPTGVFVVYPFEGWESRLLACAAVVRFIFWQLRNAEQTATLCQLLAEGRLPDGSSPTNHPEGWKPIARLLRAFQEEWTDDPKTFPLAIDAELYSDEETMRDAACWQSLDDLSDGLVDQPAAFAALEWNRTIAPALIGNGKYGRFFALDYRRITPEALRSDEHMVIRGISRVRTCSPVWILQRADQRVDEWPGFGVNPIFTQYLDNQWDWMLEQLDAVEWPDLYRKESKLVFAPKLSAACAATATRNSSYYQGKILP